MSLHVYIYLLVPILVYSVKVMIDVREGFNEYLILGEIRKKYICHLWKIYFGKIKKLIKLIG